MQQTQRQIGRPRLDVGPRHTVAVKLEQPEWDKLQEIAQILGIKPGPHATQTLIDYLRSVDLTALRNQEVLFSKAS